MLERSLHQLSLETIINGCRTESGLPRAQETGYCFELFRRALEEQEQAAWLAIDEQYRCLIFRWIHDCAMDLPQEHIEEIALDTLPKFWHALTQSTVPLADRFAHVGGLLNYLKRCAISVFREHKRHSWQLERIRQRLTTYEQALTGYSESEQELLARIDRKKLLQLVQTWVRTYVTDHQEQRVLFLSYNHGLTPAEIAEGYPQEFADVQTVRRIKERILKRAKRALADAGSGHHNGRNKVTLDKMNVDVVSNDIHREIADD